MVKRLALLDPSGRLTAELAAAAKDAGVQLQTIKVTDPIDPTAVAVLVSPAIAADLGPPPDGTPPRWVVGDGTNAARVAGAAAGAGAVGVLLTPVSVGAIHAIAHTEPISADFDLARARGLVATSLVDLTGNAKETLHAVADGFSASDCIVWWRDGNQMTPTAARHSPTETYRTQVATAARIAAAASGTVITGGPKPRAVIAEALRSGPTEVSGLVAIISDTSRRFTQAERTDLKAIAARLTRELSWLSSHRRLVAEGERLLAASLHDPLTGAMTRGAFEQTITHEVAAASRRAEKLTLAVIDIVGLRRINLAHGHKVGDEVLAQIAGRIRATVRGNDPIGRPGGDELAILLVNAPSDQAMVVLDKLIPKLNEPINVDDGSVGVIGLSVQVRAVMTEIAAGERSGEAALARCYAQLRTAPINKVHVVSPTERVVENDPSADTGSLSAGTIVGGTYRVVHELSRGAMGVVYRGEDLGLGRAVAIKVLRSDLASDRDLVSRFRAEAGLLASLHHPNLVQVYALGEHAGDVYFVMELVEGQPLSEVLRATHERQEWVPVAAVSQITSEIADALDAMHALGVIHRDVKPANILLDRERDRAVLVDVGVAIKAGDQRDAAGTPGYAAPESFGDSADAPTTDVYGLAATAYCMLTGRPPFGSGPAPQVVQRQMMDPLVPPTTLRPALSEAVDQVLKKALTPQPKKRWASASTFAVALNRALQRLPAESTPPPTPTPPPRPSAEDNIKAAETLLAPTSGITEAPKLMQVSGRVPLFPGRVRGAHLRVLSRILQHGLGESGLARVITEYPQLQTPLSATQSPLGWVDLADLVLALEQATAAMPNALVARKTGRGTMSATFAHLFGADPSSLAADTVLTALPSFWSRFHDWGEVDIAVQTGSADVVLHGRSGSVSVCALVAAELERIVELTGAKAVGAAHIACANTGARSCEFRLSWMPV